MKSCSGLEQADYRDNEGLGCCRVIAAPLQDSGFFFLFFSGTSDHWDALTFQHLTPQQSAGAGPGQRSSFHYVHV